MTRLIALIWRARRWQIVATAIALALVAVFLCLGWRWGLVAAALVYYVAFAVIGLIIAGGAAILAELLAMFFLGLLTPLGGKGYHRVSEQWRKKVWREVMVFTISFPFTWPYWLLRS